MKSLLILLFPLAVVAADDNIATELDSAKGLQFEFPMMVRATEALVALKEHYSEYCPQGACSAWQRGEYLLLDWAGQPEWRAIQAFEYPDIDADFIDLGSSIAFLATTGWPTIAGRHGSYPEYGMMFRRLQLPTVKPGPIAPITVPANGDAFVFNGITYQFKFSVVCIRSQSSNGATGYLADIHSSLTADGVEEDLLTSIQSRDPSGALPSCEEAKANTASTISFDLVGDIDGDGKLDVLFLGNGGGIFPALYLSSQAMAGALLKRYIVNTGC